MQESTIALSPEPLRVAFAGGGTGGHISPAVAVIDELRARRIPIDAIWVGSGSQLERDSARAAGAEYHRVLTGKLRRYLSFQTLVDTIRVPTGIVQARRILARHRPDVVVSTGGFVSVPSVIAARSLGVPALTHEQTADIGLATRINARCCDVVALSFERSRTRIHPRRARVIVTGNPIRPALLKGDAARGLDTFGLTPELPLVYVTGGAQGSRAINAAVADTLPTLLASCQIVHQCGPRALHSDVEMLLARRGSLPEELQRRYVVREMIGPELADLYAATALVVGRAGAGTVNELATLGIPSVLVPLPGAEEQRQNALVLTDAGGAVIIDQTRLATDLEPTIRSLATSPDRLVTMRSRARMLEPATPARLLVDEIIALARYEPSAS